MQRELVPRSDHHHREVLARRVVQDSGELIDAGDRRAVDLDDLVAHVQAGDLRRILLVPLPRGERLHADVSSGGRADKRECHPREGEGHDDVHERSGRGEEHLFGIGRFTIRARLFFGWNRSSPGHAGNLHVPAERKSANAVPRLAALGRPQDGTKTNEEVGHQQT